MSYRRRPPDPAAPRYVRRVRGGLYQARLWVGYENGGSFNLGLFRTEGAAVRAVHEVLRLIRGNPTQIAVWECCVPLLGRTLPKNLLPRGVRRCSEHPGMYRTKVGPVTAGPFATPSLALRAAEALRSILVSRSSGRSGRNSFGGSPTAILDDTRDSV